MRRLSQCAADPKSDHDLAGDVIPKLVVDTRVQANDFRDAAVWSGTEPSRLDVGTLESYYEASLDL